MDQDSGRQASSGGEDIFFAALDEIIGSWLTANKAELEDGGRGDILSLARQIERLSRRHPGELS